MLRETKYLKTLKCTKSTFSVLFAKSTFYGFLLYFSLIYLKLYLALINIQKKKIYTEIKKPSTFFGTIFKKYFLWVSSIFSINLLENEFNLRKYIKTKSFTKSTFSGTIFKKYFLWFTSIFSINLLENEFNLRKFIKTKSFTMSTFSVTICKK